MKGASTPNIGLTLSPTAFGAVLQGSIFGMAGLLPASYTTPIMSGQGLAGSFAAFAMICAIASVFVTSSLSQRNHHLRETWGMQELFLFYKR